MRIYLIGMPGSGKSTLGKSLARLLSYTFVDLDEKIVEAEGMPISEIFSRMGEDYFRKLESRVLKDTAREDSLVVATGGGAPCFFNHMDWMDKNGISIFLEVSLTEIIRRVHTHSRQKSIRPLFAGKNEQELMETLETMWQKRGHFYQKATITVSPDEAKPEKVMELIKRVKSV